MKTKTGKFPIGFRRGWTDWWKDLDGLLAFSREQGLECIDLAGDGDKDGQAVADAGLLFGSVDLPEWNALASPDKDRRDAAADQCSTYIRTCSAFGAKHFFVVVSAEDGERSREENFGYAVEGYGALAGALEETDSWVVMEGCPGPTVLACTPESYRLFLKECSARVAINYDPSHLIRQGIDPIRFLREFAPHVKHIHAKDTEIFAEGQYEFGHQVAPVKAASHGFGGTYWRYAIPGHGEMRWREAFAILQDAGYHGCVSIELEDENFNGSEEGEKEGLIQGAHFLAGC